MERRDGEIVPGSNPRSQAISIRHPAFSVLSANGRTGQNPAFTIQRQRTCPLVAQGLGVVARSRSIDLSVAGRCAGWTPGAAPCAASSLAEPLFVGLDVSKSWVDIADSAGRKQRVSNDAAALTAALEGDRGVCANMVCEATGGGERALLRVAAERALPLRRVHPNRAHACAEGDRSTRQDGRARCAKAQDIRRLHRRRAAGAPAASQTQTLAAMVSRLNQLTDLRQSESSRLKRVRSAPPSRRS
jgi:hypothetical protein